MANINQILLTAALFRWRFRSCTSLCLDVKVCNDLWKYDGGGREPFQRSLFYKARLGECLGPLLRAAARGGRFLPRLWTLSQLNKLKCAVEFILETLKNGAESKHCAWSVCHIEGAQNYMIHLYRLFALMCCQRVWRPSCGLNFSLSSLHVTQWHDQDDDTQRKIAWVCLPAGFIWLSPVISEGSINGDAVKTGLLKLRPQCSLLRCKRTAVLPDLHSEQPLPLRSVHSLARKPRTGYSLSPRRLVGGWEFPQGKR